MMSLADLQAREMLHAQPAPVDRGSLVTPELLGWLRQRGGPDVGRLVAIVEARDAFGRAKYGQGLRTGDGRDVSADLGQELADALQYAMSARLRGVDVSQWRPLIDALQELL